HNQIGMSSNLIEKPTTTLDYVQINDYVNTVPMNINTSSDFLLYPPNHDVFPDAPITASSHMILPDYQLTHCLNKAPLTNNVQTFNYDSSHENIGHFV
ncbi:33146_t:CDS:1, partial [Racocetra persica]